MIKQLTRSFFSNAAILRTVQGLTMILAAWYFMVDHSGPFHVRGFLLNEHGDAAKGAEVRYEYRLVDSQVIESKSVKIDSGMFYIGVPETSIAYVKITGFWIEEEDSKGAKNILPSMNTTEETRLLFEPGLFFKRGKRHWNPRRIYIFQEGSPVKTELATRFEE